MSTALPSIHISSNHRYFVTENTDGGSYCVPFFWLGDTAWHLFHRTTEKEAELYFANRREKGFNVIQAVALAELDGLNTPNAYGHRPLQDNDPLRPNEAYFAYVDKLIDLAEGHGLYICLLPAWGDKVTPDWGAGPTVFNTHTAYAWGKWIGARYAGRSNMIWCLGGDRPMYRGNADWGPVWRAMAGGLREAVGKDRLLTYHPDDGMTAKCVHAENWSDFVMLQSGHWAREIPVWDTVEALYAMNPPKPVLDGEPNYEDHPAAPWPAWDPKSGYFRDDEVRKQAYRSVFAGGCGVTYGHHAIWQFAGPRHPGLLHTDRTWLEALDRPGAAQMIHLKNLMLSRPFLHCVPGQSLLLSENGAGKEHIRIIRSNLNIQQFAFVYFPVPGQRAKIDLSMFACAAVRAWWYEPGTGKAVLIKEAYKNKPEAFISPASGCDWVLVLDDTRANFSPPGVVG